MTRGEGLLTELAGAILDGTPIDWEAAESSASDDERPLVSHLRLVAGVAAVRRGTSIAPPQQVAVGLTATDVTPADDGPLQVAHWGHLRLLERIGNGAFGDVYRAWDTKLDREVALKLLSVASTAGHTHSSSFIEEGRLLARVHHPNVVTIYGADRIDGRIGLWMELVKGQTLQQILEQGYSFTAAEAADVGKELCDAVSAVHAAGLLHRDVKAHNVMRSDDGHIKLMDFGTGREMNEPAAALAGTPLYLAPELLDGREPTVRSDVYSIGVLLYHLLTKSYPVHASDRRGLRLAHERGERTDIQVVRPDLPAKLARIIDKAVAPEPADRHESARALGGDLSAFNKRQPATPILRAIGVMAAILLVMWAAWELLARQKGSSSPSRVLLAQVASALLVGGTNPRPIEHPIIVVLPFENLGPDDSDYFVDGLSLEILHNLASIDGLQVRSRESSFAFKDKPINLADIARQLTANLFLEGSVRTSGNRLRVNVQLVSVGSDVLWSDQFDRELQDVFSIQEEIARGIVNRLRLKLGRGQRRYDIDVASYQVYLRARELQASRGKVALGALPLFEEVLTKHPNFAPAHAGLASTYAALSLLFPVVGNFAISPKEALTIARPAALKSLDLDPLLAEAHAAMAFVQALDRDWAAAEASFRHALSLNPALTTTYTDFVLSTLLPQAKLNEALVTLEAALRTDPLSLDVRRVMATIQVSAGLYDQALDNCRRVIAVNPAFPIMETECGRTAVLKGDIAAGLAWLEKRRDVNALWIGYAYAVSGRRAEAEDLLRKAAFPHQQAVIHAGLGDTDAAFEAMERLGALNPGRAGWFLTFPELGVLRDDPRVPILRKKLGLP